MTRLEIAGGFYCDALPTGEWACLMMAGGVVKTHLGNIQTPQSGTVFLNPLFVRVTNVGGFKFAGQSSNSPETLQWSQIGGWQRLQEVACGVSPVIYDANGVLEISRCQPGVGSQGYRYVDPDTGALVSGDATYASTFGLSEWTHLGQGWYVGQCNIEPGCAVRRGAEVRMLTRGSAARFIRGRLANDRVAVGLVQENGAPSLLIWATLAELAALPVAQPPGPTPGPVPIPTPTPEPVPPPIPSPVLNGGILLMADIAGVIHHYGTNDLGNGHVSLIANAATGDVWSAQQDGSLQTRPKGANGAFETFKLAGQIATANSFNTLHSYVAVDVTGL